MVHATLMLAAQEDFEGLHEGVNGMELMSWYRMGQSGPFSSFFKHTWHDDLAHSKEGKRGSDQGL